MPWSYRIDASGSDLLRMWRKAARLSYGKAFAVPDDRLLWIKVDTRFDYRRSDERYEGLLRCMNLSKLRARRDGPWLMAI